MNKDQLQGKWQQLKGKVQQQWGKLTDDDLAIIKGNHEKLVGKVKERYGVAKEQAEKEVDDFIDKSQLCFVISKVNVDHLGGGDNS